MTPEQKKAAEYAEILLAFSRGETIEINHGYRWETIAFPPTFGCYRVAPKPAERWVVMGFDDSVLIWKKNRQDVENIAANCGGRVALMREVTE